MKNLYSLFALGALLFVACSENASSISGSTNVPNMGNNLTPQSPVLCSVLGVTDSLEAVEKGCIWSPEMWNRTSGYRVRTGYDNGTNTSGIWTWHIDQGNNNSTGARFEWLGTATDEYDSMALADVIDKCGGSLCGKIVYEPYGNKVDSVTRFVVSYGNPYVEFYFAGKDSLGNIEEIDVSTLQGICVEFSGAVESIDLLPSDSIADLVQIARYNAILPHYMKGENLSDSKEMCFMWDEFTFSLINYDRIPDNIVYVPPKDAAAHLKGLRFNLGTSNFNIVNIGRYHLANAPTSNLHPVSETCEPIEVLSTFCECDYLDADIASRRAERVLIYLLDKEESQIREDSISLSDLTKECFASTHRSWIEQGFAANSKVVGHSPCDNPLPEMFMCADGSESESQEHARMYEEFDMRIETMGKKTIEVADSLFNYCMSLND